MNNTFSLAFSDNSYELVHTSLDGNDIKLVSCDQFSYHKAIAIDEIFTDENLDSVIESITNLKTEKGLQDVDLVFSIPFNFAVIKKVAYPSGSENAAKRNQIEWELESVISEDIKQFKISLLKDTQNKNFSETVIVALKKSLIKCLQSLAKKSQTTISGVLLNCFAVENYLENNKAFSEDQNYIFLKIGEKYLEQHFFLGKEYFTSYIDKLSTSKNRNREEVVLELASKRIKEIEGLSKQIQNKHAFDLIVYGNSVSESVMDMLKQGLSLSVEYGGIGSYSEKDGYKFIEAWGSIL